MADLNLTLNRDSNGLAKIADGRYVNPDYATPASAAAMLRIQNPTKSENAYDANGNLLGENFNLMTGFSGFGKANQGYGEGGVNNLNSINGLNLVVPKTLGTNTLSPVNGVNLPSATPITSNLAGASIKGLTEGMNNSLQGIIRQEQAKAAEAKNAVQTSTNTVQSYIDKLMGKGQAQIDAEQKAGIADKTQKLTDVTNEYNNKELEYRRMEEAVLKEGTLTDAQKQARLREISRVKNTELADIGIKQAAIQNDLKTTQSLIDRKIDLEYGDLKDIIGYQQDFLKMNKEDLSKAEQNKLNLLVQDNTRKYEEGTKIGDYAKLVAGNGAPADVISKVSSAKSYAEAVQLGGQYASNPLDNQIKQAQLANIYQNIAESQAKISPTTGETVVTESFSRVNDINNVLQNPNFDQAFGVQGLYSTLIPGSPAQTVKAQVQQVIDSAALAARSKLKGQGAVSDFEGQMLKNAQTELKFAQNASDARQALAKIRGAITTSSGGMAPVLIINTDGTSKSGMADSNMINEAIKQGYTVKYQ